jgi:predicted TIM-barrel fold metal-dependent hydrolase
MDYVETHLLDVDERLKIMDATGIERTIVSLTSPGIQWITDTELAVEVARDTNDLTKARFVDRRPDRLSMFACLPTQDGAAAAAELRRAGHRHPCRVGRRGAAGREADAAGAGGAQPVAVPVPPGTLASGASFPRASPLSPANSTGMT